MKKDRRDSMIEKAYYTPVIFGILIVLLLLSLTTQAQTKQEIRREIYRQGIKCPKVVIAQCWYETGHLSSRIYLENHNLFGMKKPSKRFSCAIGEDGDHAVFNNWKESIEDYKIWQDLYYKGGDYYVFLKQHGYATSKKYIKTLKNIRI